MHSLCRIVGLLACLFATAVPSWGQDGEAVYDDRLFLRDGSVLKGRLLHLVRGESYHFELSTGDTLVYPARKVERLIQDAGELVEVPVEKAARKPYAFQEEGLFFSTMGALGFGQDFRGDGTGNIGLALSAGWHFNRWLGVGLGVGMDVYQPESGQIVYPLFAEARGYASRKNRAPYYALRLGYGLAFPDADNDIEEARGGLLFHPAIGMRWGAAEDVNFVTDLGFQYQRAQFTFATFNGEVTERTHFKRLVFRAGILF